MAPTDWLNKIVREVGRDPARLEYLSALWRAEYRAAGSAELEQKIDNALQDLADASTTLDSFPAMRRIVAGLKWPALTVQRSGLIYDVNDVAQNALDIGFGDDIDSLPVRPENGAPLREVVADILDAPTGAGFRILRTLTGPEERAAILAMVRPSGAGDRVILFLIDPQVSGDMVRQIATSNGLTEAEAEILQSFLRGATLNEIAEDRDRSLATVRTQFNTILAKFGAPSQSALVRLVFGLSSFLSEIEDARPVFDHPHRRRFALPRPGGRTVEFYLEGDSAGRVILHPSDVLCYTFNAQTESMLNAAGLCMVSIARPGVGGTDPAPKDMPIEQCVAEDAAAILRLLEAEECITFSSGLTAPYAIHLAANVPIKVHGVVLNTPLVPPAFFRSDQGEQIPIMFALMRAERFSPRLVRFLLRSAEAHIKRVGVKRFISSQFSNIPTDLEVALSPQNLRELEHAVNAQYLLGWHRDQEDMLIVMRDWTPWIATCPAPVLIAHGPGNPVMAPQIYERLQAAYPEQVRLCPIDGARAAPGMTHPEALVELFRSTFPSAESESTG